MIMDNVSIVIPYYNRKDVIENAITSVLAQTYQNFELIIVDDGSIEPLNRPYHPQIKIIHHPHNQGAAAARNTGIKSSQHEWIAFLDSDDVWQPDKLEKQLHFIKERRVETSTTYALFGDKKRTLAKIVTKEAIYSGQGINFGSCFMARRAVFDKVGLLDTSLKRLEDWEWLIRYVNLGGVIHTAPFYGSVIHVGAAPSIEAVNNAAQSIIELYPYQNRIKSAAFIESAANYLWHGHVFLFLKYWLKACLAHPITAIKFALKRLMRLMMGDAPRIISLLRLHKSKT